MLVRIFSTQGEWHMSEQTISVPENVQIIIRAHGDLNLQGWEKQQPDELWA